MAIPLDEVIVWQVALDEGIVWEVILLDIFRAELPLLSSEKVAKSREGFSFLFLGSP